MKNIVKAVVCSQLALASLVSVMPISAKENNSSYKIEYQNADSMKSVFKKELDKKYADVKFVKQKKNTAIFESKTKKVEVKNLKIDKLGKREVTISASDSKTNEEITTQVEVKVQDTQAPEITCEDSITIEQGETFDVSNYVTTNEDATIVTTSNVDTSNVGTVSTTIQATDTAGNVSTKDITVNIETGFYQKIANAAIAQIGVNQDCTMLVTNSLAAVGINFHGWPTDYLSLGDLTNDPVPGDICVYQGHVAIYIGNGRAIHGGWLGYTTVESSVSCSNAFIGYVHVRR